MSNEPYVIREGRYYSASNVEGNLWMVKRYEMAPAFEPTDPYKESLLNVDTADPEVAIDAAIAAERWA